jgi:folate-binding protein YgfZ
MAWSNILRAQYEAATNGAGLVSLAHWTTVSISGRDRATFLHNMCTNDIRGLAARGQTEAFLTDVKGRIVAHVLVFEVTSANDELLLLLTVPNQAEKIIAHLERYIIREDVQLEDLSPVLSWSLAVGRRAAEAIESLPASATGRLTSAGLLRAPCSQIWPGGYWVAAGTGANLHLGNTAPCETGIWHALRIESGWPMFGADFDSANLPQEVGRDAQAISFRKGCYLGQETVARIDALGHVNKRLTTVRLAGEAAAGDELFADQDCVGRISSATYSPKLDAWLALAMVRRGHNEPGATLTCRGQPAEVTPTPAVAG